jgi:hypothetical protein
MKTTASNKQPAFQAQLAPKSAGKLRGYSMGGNLSVQEIACKAFGATIPGAMLACYMLRRFGWPNSGSDPYKDAWCWDITTPMDGVYLHVSPYLAEDGQSFDDISNLHFGIRATNEILEALMHDPGREAFWKRRDKAVAKWWTKTGSKLYTWGRGGEEGDTDILVARYGGDKGKVWGLWKRTPKHTWKNILPSDGMITWWIADFLKKQHPKVKLPEMNAREKSRRTNNTHRKVVNALKATMRDLMRPTYVRDFSFTPFGDIEHNATAIKHQSKLGANYFKGAGMTPEYYYLHATTKEKRGEE